ncbi:MAG: primosomal protein N' [Candidatus Hydrogenedentes bacterium]|nr:primosomal protein N' [Candidatus Hydrogenedentota bacterium]
MNERAFVDVILPIPLDRPFTYAVPAALRHRAAAGMRAIVPFQKRIETGTIVALAPDCALEKVRSIIDLPDEGPLLSQELLDLCRWIADYYCCSWGEALHSAVPAGIAVRSKMRYALQLDQLGAGRYTERQRKVIAEIHRRGPLTEKQLAQIAGATALSNTLRTLCSRGILRAEPVAVDSAVSIQTETCVRLIEAAVPAAAELERLQRRAPKQAAVYLDLLHGEPERVAAHLYENHGIAAATLKALEERGLIARFEREFYRTPEFARDGHAARKHELNAEQHRAFESIMAVAGEKRYQTYLLQGITGSGKTEVYLQAIEAVLSLGRDAIMLVPEISLTPQTVGRFKARFNTDIAVLHSGLGAGERYDEWRRAQRGEVRIVVGARSAIFAPLPDVGIIIVDEEHDTSYKQGDTPRYHARDVAVYRARMNHAVCVLGSATPSVESRFNSERGKSTLLTLSRRATQAALPGVELVDMRIETRETGPNAVLSRRLEEAVTERVRAGEQVLLLLNRRGFAPFVLCPQCGWVAECPDCNVSMTYHAKGSFLSCHYCAGRCQVPQVCDACYFNPLLFLGAGTQKIEDYLLRAFPQARIERMDADTTSGKGGHARILGRLAQGEIDILVGTQMIAKGHDYPGVTLVGVINADTGLSLPDFRAAESTFQLLTQVAGRAGRGERPGSVLIQTYRPHHYALQAAAQHDYGAFYGREIHERERALYPPFRRMANLMIESEDPEEAERGVGLLHRKVRDAIVRLGFHGIEVLGPSPATVRRVKKKYRWNLGILSKSATRVNQLCRAVRTDFEESAPASVHLKVDLDPYGTY